MIKIIKTLTLGFAMYLVAAIPVFAATSVPCSNFAVMPHELMIEIAEKFIAPDNLEDFIKCVCRLRVTSKRFNAVFSDDAIVGMIKRHSVIMQNWQDSFDAYAVGGFKHAVEVLYLAAKKSGIDVRQALFTPNPASNEISLHRAIDASAAEAVKLILEIAGQEGVGKELCAIPDALGRTPLRRVVQKPLTMSCKQLYNNLYIIALLCWTLPKDACIEWFHLIKRVTLFTFEHALSLARTIFICALVGGIHILVVVLFAGFFEPSVRDKDAFIVSRAMLNNRWSQCYTIEHLQDLERSIQNYAGSQCPIPELVAESTRLLLQFLARDSLNQE